MSSDNEHLHENSDEPAGNNEFESAFSEQSFWAKLAGYAKKAGREVVEKALLLYYAAQEPATPKWAKATIAAALGYFIVPLDAVTDLAPIIGYTDDLGVLALAVATVAVYINDTVRAKTADKMRRWFGENDVDIQLASAAEDDHINGKTG